MNLKPCLFLALLFWQGHFAAAESFRTDINPALLYWQAFAVMPDLPAEDQKYLFDTEWRNRPMDERAGRLALRFDNTFRLMRRAAASNVACDWGVDMSDGPQVLLSHLGKAKRCAQAASMRARWFVQHQRQDAARDDLVAAFVLARNLSRDQVLISGLVQFAMESIVSGYIVQQWPQLEDETIGALLAAFDTAPPRGTMAACMRTEKSAFYDWMVRQVEAIQAKYPAGDPQGVARASELITDMVSEEGQSRKELAAEVLRASGNSVAGLLQSVRQLEPFYTEAEQTMKLPYSEFQPAMDQLQERVRSHPNLLLREFFPAFAKVRLKEFRITARLAMVRAAYQHRIDPVDGLKQVQDPFGAGQFEFSRFLLDGSDRGFKLKSQLRVPDFDEVLIFAETPGPAFSIDGPNAGQKVP